MAGINLYINGDDNLSPADLGYLLRRQVADPLRTGEVSGPSGDIVDGNGNPIGAWTISQ